MRRLNERDEDYSVAIKKLEEKCIKSGFDKNLVKDMISITKQWKDRFSPPTESTTKPEQRLVWATQFPKLLKLSHKEKELNPKAMITFKRPITLAGLLTNYRTIAHGIPSDTGSRPCNHCALCGHYGKKRMVNNAKTITSSSGKVFHIKQNLTCKDFGVYVATCKLCPSQYVGQTVKSFSTRWSGHRAVWKNGCSDVDDRAALRIHYIKNHPNVVNLDLADAFEVTFVDKPKHPVNLDIVESSWISRLHANININRTPLPMYR